MRQRYVRIQTNQHDVLVDEPIAAHLRDGAMYPTFVLDDEYPVVAELGTTPSSSRGNEYLHSFVWRFFVEKEQRRALEHEEVIHHIEGHKWDARLAKLDHLPRWLHNRLHRCERQKFAPRHHEDLRGFHQSLPPGEVRSRPEMVGQQREHTLSPASRSWRTGLLPEEIEAETVLAGLLWGLRQRLRHLESSRRIPRSAGRDEWRAPKSRMLGLKLPRLGCTPGEAALVYLMVEHGFNPTAAALAVAIHVGIIERMLLRPALRIAIDRWRQHRRFPTPVPLSG